MSADAAISLVRILGSLMAVAILTSILGCQSTLPDHWDSTLRLGNNRIRLQTDVPLQEAKAALKGLTRIYVEYEALFKLPPDRQPSEPLRVLLFRNVLDFSTYTGLTSPVLEQLREWKKRNEARGVNVEIGKAQFPGGQYRNHFLTKSLALFRSNKLDLSMRHEVAHFFIDTLDRPDRWFNEGMAEVLSKNSRSRILEALGELERRLQRGEKMMPLDRLIHAPRESTPMHYLQAWLLVYDLVRVRRVVSPANYSRYSEEADALEKRKTMQQILARVVHSLK
jgi:hypothetical protein